MVSCGDSDQCTATESFSGCVCDTGFALKNGACVPTAECRIGYIDVIKFRESLKLLMVTSNMT